MEEKQFDYFQPGETLEMKVEQKGDQILSGKYLNSLHIYPLFQSRLNDKGSRPNPIRNKIRHEAKRHTLLNHRQES